MTTERASAAPDDDRAARLAALRAKRASSAPRRSATATASDVAPTQHGHGRRRRRHAAAGARIFVAGLSGATALALVGVMAGSAGSTGAAQVVGTASSGRPVVVVVRGSGTSQVAAPRVASSSARAVTSSHGS